MGITVCVCVTFDTKFLFRREDEPEESKSQSSERTMRQPAEQWVGPDGMADEIHTHLEFASGSIRGHWRTEKPV